MLETILKNAEVIAQRDWNLSCQYGAGWESGIPYLAAEEPFDEIPILHYEI